MDSNFLNAGVPLGGFQDTYLVRILICYILDSVKTPLSKDDLNHIFQKTHLVDYFIFSEALAQLVNDNHVTLKPYYDNDCYYLNAIGVEAAHVFKKNLPSSVRDKVVNVALDLLARIKKERENTVSFQETKNGIIVTCTIHDTDFDLLSFNLLVADIEQANIVKRNFLSNPLNFYQKMMKLLLDKNIVE